VLTRHFPYPKNRNPFRLVSVISASDSGARQCSGGAHATTAAIAPFLELQSSWADVSRSQSLEVGFKKPVPGAAPRSGSTPNKNRCYAGTLTFEFYRFRFHFRSAGILFFPVYKSGNIVRGAFGDIFRKLVCIPSCHGAKTCDIRADCPYARVFEPQAARGEGPSGLADWPRPFVFRAAHLDGSTIRQGESFHFDIHIFDVRDPALPYFVLAFAQLAREGLGPGRALAALTSVDQLDLNEGRVAQVFDGEQFRISELSAPNVMDLSRTPERNAARILPRLTGRCQSGCSNRRWKSAEDGLFGRLIGFAGPC
jgi:hypothetical protein